MFRPKIAQSLNCLQWRREGPNLTTRAATNSQRLPKHQWQRQWTSVQLLKWSIANLFVLFSCRSYPSSSILWLRLQIAHTADNKVVVRCINTGDKMFDCETLDCGHSTSVLVCQFSPDGEMLATGGQDKCVKVWNAHYGELIKSFSYIGEVHALAWAPDCLTLASGGTGQFVKFMPS